MRTFVLSLRRNYERGFITIAYIDNLLSLEKINQEEHDYIIA